MSYLYRNEKNKGAYTKEMLDTIPEGWGMTIREYLGYFIDGGFLDNTDIDNMSDEAICMAIDFVEYMEAQ